jgi:hypothetical protein
LGRCGVAPEAIAFTQSQGEDPNRLVAMRRFADSGVTTLLVLGQSVSYYMMPAATRVGFRPEWVGVGDEGQYSPGAWSNSPDQSAQALGIAAGNKPVPGGADPYSQVVAGRSGYTPRQADAGFYAEMLILASGIQMAGPRLTPATFGAALQDTDFPNPGAGAPPTWQASVGFANGHAMLDDVGVWWWDGTASNGNAQPGNFCLARRGQRWSLGTWPSERLPLFDKSRGC